MAILITGGAGYIGSHTCVELLSAGSEIVVLDNFLNSKPQVLKRITEITGCSFRFYNVDLLDEIRLEKVFLENEIKAVIHFAGLKAVGESVSNPTLYYHNNLMSTLILCKLMKKYNVKKLVFSSSATVYGSPERLPISEDSPLGAKNPYGRSKHMIEEILNDLYLSDNHWSISILRYFNPVGAHESGLLGEDPNGMPNNLMPYISQVAIGKLKELKVYGNGYPTFDGTGVRDYIHVVDLAFGHLKALERVTYSTGVEVYNLGTGKGNSVLELISAFEKATGKNIPYKIVDPRPGDVSACYANPEKAKKNLGWIAKKSLEEMCRDTWRWQINNPDGFESKDYAHSHSFSSEDFLFRNKV
ncbi:UDP-glucose 4-epimerase GalE [Bacillus sp. ISL-41]|uniref:UDP-glucose 4-epimerase GalE n=1 Tax=Bacillus sp. ISL-41 TaxID=2819127 RepID=UPI001BEA365F|nr:UDP-glucose 4-epimerase GalE [Bacillus sp. ISL-41]MBT2642191.1 UDP-glucose 4-epimerase GalE [Bacillus sp. ISL-41]